MKKALMVLGLAMCTTMVFAQTNKVPAQQSVMRQLAKNPTEASVKHADYKGSIFSKSIDTIKVWHFGPAQRDSIIYGTNAIITAADTADMLDTNFRTPHGAVALNWTRWNLIENMDMVTNRSSAFYTQMNYGTSFLENRNPNFLYTRLVRYFNYHTQWRYDSLYNFNYAEDSATMGGFMLMTRHGATQYSGATNAYVQFPKVKIPEGAASIDVSMLQVYTKYYDYCLVEYRDANNKWQPVMFNIDGIDMDVNTSLNGRVNVTLPTTACSLDSLEVRIRYYSNQPNGYMWAIDNVAYEVRSGADASRWRNSLSEYVEGYYGIIPQNMSLPLSWYAMIENNGGYARTDVKATVYHLDANRANPTVVQEATYPNILPDSTAYLEIDDRNMYYPGYYASYHGFDGAGHDTTFGDDVVLHSLPVSTPGKQFVTVTATSKAQGYEATDTIATDTMCYFVSAPVSYTVNGVTYEGYRWGHDNGILANNSAFTFGYTDEEVPGTDPVRYYLGDTGHYNRNGYAVMSKFVTGQDIPEGWVFLGLELVAATTYDDPSVIAGNTIVPQVYYWPWETYTEGDGSYVRYYTLSTGAENYTVQDDDANYLSNSFYMKEDGNDDFKHIFIPFPDQPKVFDTTGINSISRDHNGIYYFGYKMTSDGRFATAAVQNYYWRSGQGTFFFSDSSDSRDYAGIRSLSPYDVFVDDGGLFYAGGNAGAYPMIRVIVGPEVEIPYDTVFIEGGECDFGDFGETTYGIGSDRYNNGNISYYLCDAGFDAIPLGNTRTYTITAADGYHIDKIYIDGQEVQPWDDNLEEGDENLVADPQVWYEYVGANDSIQHYRTDYLYTFYNIDANHTIRVTAREWQATDGINEAANNVKLNLRPNPATGMVRISMEGVSGNVDCNIIDMSGRVVYSSQLNADGENIVNLNKVAPGAYFVRITNSKLSKVEKLIVR